jgi:hypothetical protein
MKRFLFVLPVIFLSATVSYAQIAGIDMSGLAVLTDDGDGEDPDLNNRGQLMCFSDEYPNGIPCRTRAECVSSGLPADQCALDFPQGS